MKRKNVISFIVLLLIVSCSTTNKLWNLKPEVLTLKQEQDFKSIKIYRNGLSKILKYIKSNPEIFSQKKLSKAKLLSYDTRKEALAIWKRLLDYYLAMDSIASFHKDFTKLQNYQQQEKSFYITYAAFLAEYRYALEIIEILENNSTFDVLFNEPVADLGLPKGMYSKFKFRFLNVATATEFAAFKVSAKMFKKLKDRKLLQAINEDSKVIWKAGNGKGQILTLKNGLNILKQSTGQLWFPVQKGVSNWMGNTKVYRLHNYLITKDQIQEISKKLKPGDILLERREWYLTNIGIPGFWTHAALYIGTKAERDKFFKGKRINTWLKKNGAASFDSLLKKQNAKIYALSTKQKENGVTPRVIEAIGEGVLFTTLEYSATCDSLAVLRPKISKKEKALALLKAFSYSGRPYDYNFDFISDSTLVCTELVYKAYEKSKGTRGLNLPLERVMGHILISANSFCKLFDKNYGSNKNQLDYVLFYDGFEQQKKAYKSNVYDFRKSWQRPKWHVFIKR